MKTVPYVAYLKAKDLCYRQMETIGHLFTTLLWPVEEFQRARALMGDDFWSYGVAPNRRELQAVALRTKKDTLPGWGQ